MLLRTTTTLAFAAALAAPAFAQQAGERQQEMSQQARECVGQLERIDQRLGELGYGRVGPDGYGAYGGMYGGAYRDGTPGVAGRAGMVGMSPRADMYTLMRAGYVMARTGHGEGCQAVVQAVTDVADRYHQAMQDGDIDADELRQWRGDYLGQAVSVTELDQRFSVDRITGADVRNLRDEDLGDIENVVLGPDGGVQYVIVSTGGFLGIGDDEVPVPWRSLKVTPAPYQDTFVLDVGEAELERAPRLGDRDWSDLAVGNAGTEFDQYWSQALGQDRG